MKKSIDSCLTKNEFTDTFTVDHLLSKLNSDSTNILSCLSPIDNVGVPYFEKYLKASQMEGQDFLGIPLCDGVHFQGYIIDVKGKKILHIDFLRSNHC